MITTAKHSSRDGHAAAGLPRVHVFQTGRLVGNKTFLRAEAWSGLLRRRVDYEFPALAFVLEHPEGLIAIDTGMTTRARRPFSQRRFVPRPVIRPEEEIGPQMRARGLDPADVRRVVITHLDWDHVGGVAHFPNAEVLVHRPEWEFAATRLGRSRYRSGGWPAGFRPTVYDLEPEPCGPFSHSRRVTGRGDVRLVPIPGHSIGQVAAVVQSGDGPALFFAADHVLRQDWFVEDMRAGRLLGLGLFHPKEAADTSRRLRSFCDRTPTVLLPSHDSEAPERLAAMRAVEV